MIRLRGNTKHTQKNGFEPGEITVEITVDRKEDYEPGTISDYTQRVHRELQHACNAINGATTETPQATPKNVFSTITTESRRNGNS